MNLFYIISGAIILIALIVELVIFPPFWKFLVTLVVLGLIIAAAVWGIRLWREHKGYY